MSAEDRTKWDAKYRTPGYRRGGAAASLLRGVAPALPETGRALDVASGEGQTAVFLADRGLDVVGIDISSFGIAKAVQLAEQQGVADRVSFIEYDLDQGLPDVPGPFDVITCVHFHAPELWPHLRERLAPGGVIVIETLTTENVERGLPAPSARFLAEPGQLLGYAHGLRIRLYREALIDGTIRAQLLAQHPDGAPPDLRKRRSSPA